MKSAIIFLSGKLNVEADFYKNINYSEYDIYCADGGANYAHKLGVTPKLILGDLDSVSIDTVSYFEELGVEIEKFPTSKNFTDGELILEKVSPNYDEVLILGGLGGRTDHFLTNLNLLEKYQNIVFEDSHEILFWVKNNMELKGEIGRTISFIPLTTVESLTLEGFAYNVENLQLPRSSSRCMSNIINSKIVHMSYTKGSIIGIIQKIK
jgi:thiamine pyrophosphokinase